MATDPHSELVAAGAVLMLLLSANETAKVLTTVNVVTDVNGSPTNKLDVTFTFLRNSSYRITVEQT